ncbi:hypothetical protein, variant [Aphanomyces astaci]|uniref:Uncharacterized protein n=1 Tax=Aphanomyces astaci TaxID=112090 RepID=W4H8G0_APHAT|nr:hypothetical protein, variant [Aphanomyces astaci]ETV88330.1 hypothetical protein, variant [Aphanomyces astaci]|eukprot:XP_009823193.1 hypothetical protein, variant [Aphanomyces astaci]
MQDSTLHHRRSKAAEDTAYGHSSSLHLHDDGTSQRKRAKGHFVRLWVVLAWVAGLVAFTFWRHLWLPKPKSSDIPLHEFSEGRARVFLEELQSIEGFRTVGSKSNEELTPAWLLAHLHTFQQRCVAPCQLDIEVQRPTGAFGLDFLSKFQNVYANVTNIVVRVQRTTLDESSTPAILLSSHYDAAVGAGAASDDGVNIAIMLELLQNVVASETMLPSHNALMFNFNGAEETMLQAAHGFITQHPWKDQVAAFINLEASGAGGRELLFQTGSDILAMAYARGAPYPHASTIAQEVFQSGVIPGVTDYTVYSEHGEVAGMDFAFIANGYVYHTPLDDISRIQQGSIQRFGENIQGTLAELFKDPAALHTINSSVRAHRHVFFDLFGVVTVTYSEAVGEWVNYLVVVLALVYCAIWSRLPWASKWQGVLQLIKMNALAFTSSMSMAGLLLVLAPMSWYASPVTHLWVFIFPTVVGYLTVFPCTETSAVQWTEMFVEGLALLWMALSVLLMAAGVQSAYLSISWVLFPLFSYALFHDIATTRASSIRTTLALVVGPAIPLVYFLQVDFMVLQVFIPIMGRVGNILPVDCIMAVLLSILTTITLSAITPLLCLVRPSSLHVLHKYTVLGSVASVVVAILSNSYSADCPKRLGLNHIYRNFSQLNLPDDWGMWINACDYLGLEPLRPAFASNSKWSHRLHAPAGPEAPITIFDNFPWFYPISHIIPVKHTWYLPANPPDVQTIPTYVDVVSSSYDDSTDRRQIHFRFNGPSHANLYIDATNTTLTAWSLGQGRDGVPPAVDECYILQLASGSATSSFHFWIEVESNATLNVAYCGFYLDLMTADLEKTIDTLPPWATQSHAVASWGILQV